MFAMYVTQSPSTNNKTRPRWHVLKISCRLNRRQGIKEDAALNNLNGLSLQLSDLPSADQPAKATVREYLKHRNPGDED